MSKFLKCFGFWSCLLVSVSAMEFRPAIDLDKNYPESPLIHAYNGFSPCTVHNIKLLSQFERGEQSVQQITQNYYQSDSHYEAKDLNCEIAVDIKKFREIFRILDSKGSPEFYITVLRSSKVIDDPFNEGCNSPLFRPHYAYYNPDTIGWMRAKNFRLAYKTTSFRFTDAYCKTRTCYEDPKSKKLTFANQCWNASQQSFSIHVDDSGINVVLSAELPTIKAVKRNASSGKSCAVFYASKLKPGLSVLREREIFGLVLILNEEDMQIFNDNFSNGGLSEALKNNSILGQSNTALEIFPKLWND